MRTVNIPDESVRKHIRNLCLSLDQDFREVEVLREIRLAYCPCCKRVVQAVFLAHQYSKGVRCFDLYNCPVDGDTIALNESEEWKRRHG